MGPGRVLRKQRQERRLSRNCQGGKRRTAPRKLRENKGLLQDWWSDLTHQLEKNTMNKQET